MTAMLLITIETVIKDDGKKELVVGKTIIENPRTTEKEKLVNECLTGAIDIATNQLQEADLEAKEAKRLRDGMDVICAYVAKTSHLKAPGDLRRVAENLSDMTQTLLYRDGPVSLPDEEEENG